MWKYSWGMGVGGMDVGVAANRRMSNFTCCRTQIFIKECRRPKTEYLPEPFLSDAFFPFVKQKTFMSLQQSF